MSLDRKLAKSMNEKLKQIKDRFLIPCGLAIGVLASVAGLYFYSSSEVEFVCTTSFGLFLYSLLKELTRNKATSFFSTLGIIALISFSLIFIDEKKQGEHFEEYGTILTTATIKNINNYKGNHSLECQYETVLGIYLNIDVQCAKEICRGKNIGDKILIRYSKITHNDYRVVDYYPTPQEIEKYRRTDILLYSARSQKIKMAAKVYDKHLKCEDWGAEINKYYFVKVQFKDSISDFIEIDDFRRRDIYESLQIGDTIIAKMVDGKKRTIQIINWKPTKEEKERYKNPVRLIEE